MNVAEETLRGRVAALEEGLRDLWECWDTGQDDDVLDVHFQKARALLDDRDAWQERGIRWHRVAISRESDLAEARRRVVALEEGLLALVQDMDSQNVGTNVLELTDPPIWHGLLGGKPYAKARALLADSKELSHDD